MPSIAFALGASAASGNWRDERINDDRLHVDAARGLAFVADASGPTYGGYHAPFAIDPGIAALRGAFLGGEGPTRERLAAAVRAASASMRALHEAYETCRAGRVGLEAARAIADAVRPPAWAGYDSFAHFMGSVTACAVGGDGVVVAQVGECRAYALRDGAPTLLVPDHTLPSVLEARGASAEEVAEARRDHAGVVVALLGGEHLTLDLVEVRAPATIALVTNGVWRCDAALAAIFRAEREAELERVLRSCADEARDDATAVVLQIET